MLFPVQVQERAAKVIIEKGGSAGDHGYSPIGQQLELTYSQSVSQEPKVQNIVREVEEIEMEIEDEGVFDLRYLIKTN
jgi:hypothetical protein